MKTCHKCGTRNSDNTRFCTKCGQNLTNETSDGEAAWKATKIIAVIVIILGCLVGSGFLISSGNYVLGGGLCMIVIPALLKFLIEEVL